MIGGRVLDATALVDAATGGTIYIRSFVNVAVAQGIVLTVPTTALQDAWARTPPDAHPSLEVLLGLSVVVVDDLTEDAARSAGIAGRDARGGRYTTTAAHVVHSAVTRGWPILTTDPAPLEAIDPEVLIERLPD